MTPEFLTLPNRRLAYQRLIGAANTYNNGPGVVFLGGFASDMTGTKASFLAERCKAQGCDYLRFDYRGHGHSGGDFRESTLGDWLEDTLAAFDTLTNGPQIVVGSSMGGWLALLLAMQRPERVKALVGVAAAPDFTEDLIWLRLSLAQRTQLERDGFIYDETMPPEEQAPVTLKLIEEARRHLLLHRIIPVTCPVHLLQGMDDAEVPWQHALRILENIEHGDVRATFIKDGNHRLSRPQDLAALWRAVGEFL